MMGVCVFVRVRVRVRVRACVRVELLQCARHDVRKLFKQQSSRKP